VLEAVTKIRALDMEVCTTLGMLTPEQAKELREAGLTAYNHNLDTSPEYYEKVTTTRKYEDRLDTIESVRQVRTWYSLLVLVVVAVLVLVVHA
jgi:biotin synthase